jgi:hypothetical protein
MACPYTNKDEIQFNFIGCILWLRQDGYNNRYAGLTSVPLLTEASAARIEPAGHRLLPEEVAGRRSGGMPLDPEL